MPGLNSRLSLYSRPAPGSQQGEAMYRSIAIPRISSARGYAQKYLFSSGQCDLRSYCAAYFITTVLVRQQFNDTDLSVKRQRGKDHGSRGDSQEPAKNEFLHALTRQTRDKGYCVM